MTLSSSPESPLLDPASERLHRLLSRPRRVHPEGVSSIPSWALSRELLDVVEEGDLDEQQLPQRWWHLFKLGRLFWIAALGTLAVALLLAPLLKYGLHLSERQLAWGLGLWGVIGLLIVPCVLCWLLSFTERVYYWVPPAALSMIEVFAEANEAWRVPLAQWLQGQRLRPCDFYNLEAHLEAVTAAQEDAKKYEHWCEARAQYQQAFEQGVLGASLRGLELTQTMANVPSNSVNRPRL